MKFKLFYLLLLLGLSFSAIADVVVITYNMAQLKKNGFDFVPCTERRLDPQMQHMFQLSDAPIKKEKYFVYALQEVWTKKAFKKIQATVKDLGYNMFPTDHKSVKANGVITVTNLKVLENYFTPYTRDTYAKKGILYTLAQTDEGEKLGFLNVHTGFSGNKEVSATHMRQFMEIGEFILKNKKDSDYQIVAGDFNSGPDISFEKQFYQVADAVWENGIIPVMNGVRMSHVPVNGVTWDQTSNPLVYKPTLAIRLFNTIEHGNAGWGQHDSTMDHIFLSKDIEVKESDIVFKEPVEYKCPKRTSPDGKSTLSDHYGVMAIVRLLTKPVISGTNP